MLKRAVFALAASGLVLLGAVGVASAAELKIGVVDLQKALDQSPQLKSVKAALSSEFSRRQQELLDRQKQLRKLEEKLTRDNAVMSSSELERLQKDLISRKRALKNDGDAYEEDLALRKNEELNKLLRQIQEVVVKISKDQQMDLVLSTDGRVAYANKRINLTEQVIDGLRKESSKR